MTTSVVNNCLIFGKTGKQKGTSSSTETDNKMASSGLTEKQLQLSVEVW